MWFFPFIEWGFLYLLVQIPQTGFQLLKFGGAGCWSSKSLWLGDLSCVKYFMPDPVQERCGLCVMEVIVHWDREVDLSRVGQAGLQKLSVKFNKFLLCVNCFHSECLFSTETHYLCLTQSHFSDLLKNSGHQGCGSGEVRALHAENLSSIPRHFKGGREDTYWET